MLFSLTITISASFSTLAPPNVHFEPVHSSLMFDEPVQVLFDGQQDDLMYVVEKKGVVRVVTTNKEETEKPIFLDITDRVGVTNDEEGLLSLAFHPNYKENGKLYVWYSSQEPHKRGVLSRFVKNRDEKLPDTSNELVILEVRQPWGNHNGGTILFGPDGYLYLGIGDGGAANDPYGNGQNKNTLLGSIIRIDVDASSSITPYSVPNDNPLVGQDSFRPELWAWGLRNPWRMSFDSETGALWTGDVGQNKWEEVDIIKKGGNYGWNAREGKHAFKKAKGNPPQSIDPVHEYGRREGGSITGGHVYRGANIPSLNGSYIFSDYISRMVWALQPDDEDEPSFTPIRIAKKTPIAIASFGETPSGEILACGFPNPYASKGKIYQLFPLETKEPIESP